jgi:hypothetical protein
MKIVSKTIVPADVQVFTRIEGDTTSPYEIRGTGDIPIEDSEFVPLLEELDEEDIFIPDEEDDPIEEGPEGPEGPAGPQGFQGPPGDGNGGGIVELWTNPNPTIANNFQGIPIGTTFPEGTSSIQILESLLYPIIINFTSFNMFTLNFPKTLHIGDKINSPPGVSGGIFNSSWVLTGDIQFAVPNSVRISTADLSLTSDVALTGGNSSFGNTIPVFHPIDYTFNNETQRVFTISITGGYNNNISRTDIYSWRCPLFVFKSASENLEGVNTLPPPGFTGPILSNGNQISLPIVGPTLSTMRNGISYTLPSTPEETFLYWLVPFEQQPDPSGITGSVGSSTNLPPNYNNFTSFTDVSSSVPQPVPMITLPNFTNSTTFGLNITYKVFRSSFKFSGQRTIRASE